MSSGRGEEPVFSLGHLSDLHATPVVVENPLHLLNKRFFGWLSWRIRRRHYHRTSVVDALMNDLSHVAIDHLVVTGDLTNLSLASEFGAAREHLKQLGDARNVSIVPGNHDAYVRVAQAASWNLWSDYFESDDGGTTVESSDPRDRFPTLRVRGPLAVVGLCSALPTRLFDATGTLGEAQLERLERMLHGLSERDLCRVISIHHPITEGATHARRWLRDAESLRDVIGRARADLVVHGHNHRTLLAAIGVLERSHCCSCVLTRICAGGRPRVVRETEDRAANPSAAEAHALRHLFLGALPPGPVSEIWRIGRSAARP